MDLLIYLLIFLVSIFLFYVIFSVITARRTIVKDRLDEVKALSGNRDLEDEFSEPFLTRLFDPIIQGSIRFISNLTPKTLVEKYEHLIITSGYSGRTTFGNVILIQIMLSVVLMGIYYLGINFLTRSINYRIMFLVGILGFLFPFYFLYYKSTQRKEAIKRKLPDLLDLLYVSVGAGLSFDSALKKTSEKMSGPLSDEVNRALNEINRGRAREDAFRSMAYRTGVDDVSSFVATVIQTEQFGSSISNMLKIQSTTMRRLRRQRAEEASAKMPIKMLFPLIFLMFPALFVVILGPAVISIMEVLGGM